MVLVLPKAKGFGEQLGEALGGGVQKGADFALQIGMEKFKQNQRKKLIEQIEGGTTSLDQGKSTPEKFAEDIKIDPFSKAMSKAKQYAAAGEHDLSRQAVEEAKIIEKRQVRKSEKQEDRAFKFLDRISDMSDGLPERDVALNSARQAINSDQMNAIGGDFWADILHIPALKTASGATLDAAAKTNLIGSLKKAGARPNQFIEQQVNNAFARSGNTKEANLNKLEIAQAVKDIDQKYVDLAREMATKFKDNLPGDLDLQVQEGLKPYVDQRMKELAYDLQENIEKDKGPEKMAKLKEVSKGTPLTLQMRDVLFEKIGADPANPTEEDIDKVMKMAKRLGYEIPEFSVFSREK